MASDAELNTVSPKPSGDGRGPISHQSLTYLPDEGILVLTDAKGAAHFYDSTLETLLGSLDSPVSSDPILSSLVSSSGKLLLARGSCLSARGSVTKGRFLLDTAFQSIPNDGKETISIEILPEDVRLLLHEINTSAVIPAGLSGLVKDIAKTLQTFIDESVDRTNISSFATPPSAKKWRYCIIKGPLDDLLDLFKKLCTPYQPSKSGAKPEAGVTLSPVVPVLSAIRFRLLLLNRSFSARLIQLEGGREKLGSGDMSLMYSEGMRRLAYSSWPHKNYIWAEPNKMAEAGLYPLLNASATVSSLAHSKGDRTTCFTCGMYVHRWLSSDEPWSEHTRHSQNCPYVKGEYTVNVTARYTQATHPAVCVSSPIHLISPSLNTTLVATVTLDGNIQVWQTKHGLFLQEYGIINLQQELLNKTSHSPPSIRKRDKKTTPTKTLLSDHASKVIRITSLCMVAMEAQGRASAGTQSTPSLIIGCIVENKKGKEDSCILVYSVVESTESTSINSSVSQGSVHTTAPPPPTGLLEGVPKLPDNDLFELIMEELGDDPLVASSFEGSKLYLSEMLNGDGEGKKGESFCLCDVFLLGSCCTTSTDSSSVLSTNETTPTSKATPIITSIIPLPYDDLIAVVLSPGNTREEAEPVATGNHGSLLLYRLFESDNGSTSFKIDHCVKKITFDSRDDVIVSLSGFRSGINESLLATVSLCGALKVFNVKEGLKEVMVYTDGPVTGCVYCKGLDKLAITSPDGSVSYIGIETIVKDREEGTIERLSTGPMLTDEDLGLLKDLAFTTESNGLPFIGFSHNCWTELHPLQYYQYNPRHMLQKQERSSLVNGSELFNTKIWKYQPELDNGESFSHTFQIKFSSEEIPSISSLRIKINVASPACISDQATLSLSVLRIPSCDQYRNSPAGSEDQTRFLTLCGPIFIKPYIDVTDLSLTVSLSHPLLLSSHQSTLLLSFEDLFPLNYSSLTKEMADSESAVTSDQKTYPSRRSFFKTIIVLSSQLLEPILKYCYVTAGSRLLAHKCAQFISILSRSDGDDTSTSQRDSFLSSLSDSFISLSPSLPLVSSSYSLQWFLRQLCHYVPPHLIGRIGPVLLEQLVGLSHERLLRDSSFTQLLQTHFNQDGSIFDSELFDVSISSSKLLPRPPLPSSSSSSVPFTGSYTEYIDYISNPDYSPDSKETTPTSQTPKTPTLYNPEFLLLLHGETKDSSSGDKKESASPFRDGSYLLSFQRGLLETLPLKYTCCSLSAGVIVRPPVDSTKNNDNKLDPLLTAYLNIHQPLNHYGYLYPHKMQDHALQNLTPPTSRTPDPVSSSSSLSKLLSRVPESPDELSVSIDNIKPGTSHSIVIDFSEIIRLTDFSIQSNHLLSSVSVCGWPSQEESESIKLVQSTELASRMVAIGNLAPPPLVRYIRLTFVSVITTSSERCVISLGQYYGKPLLPVQGYSPSLLSGLEARLSSQYLHSLKELKDLLKMFHRGNSLPLLRKQFKKHLLLVHQRCFEAQVKLNRIRNQIREINENQINVDSTCGTTDQITDSDPSIVSKEKEEVKELFNYNSVSLKKLIKFTSCITNTLLLLSNRLHPSISDSLDAMRMGRDECRALFLSVCLNTGQSIHSRMCALLVKLCGAEEWWGDLLAELFHELFNSNQPLTFNKERVILQFSALCQCTMTTNFSVLEELLSLLTDTLRPLVSQDNEEQTEEFDSHCVQWLTLLLSHVLSSNDARNKDSNVFVPTLPLLPHDFSSDDTRNKDSNIFSLPLIPPSPVVDAYSDMTAAEIFHKISRLEEAKDLLETLFSLVPDPDLIAKLNSLRSQVKRIEKTLNKFAKAAQQRETDHGGKGPNTTSQTDSHSGSVSMNLRLSDIVLKTSSEGLVCLLVRYCKDSDWDKVPIVCKTLTALLCHMSCSLSISFHQLKTLITSTCQKPSLIEDEGDEREDGRLVSFQWACHAVQTLVVGLVLREKRLAVNRKNLRSRKESLSGVERIHSSLSCIEVSLNSSSIVTTSSSKNKILDAVSEEGSGLKEEDKSGANDEECQKETKKEDGGVTNKEDGGSQFDLSSVDAINNDVPSGENSSDSSDDSQFIKPPPPPPPLSSSTPPPAPKKILKSSKSTTSLQSSLHKSIHKKLSMQEKLEKQSSIPLTPKHSSKAKKPSPTTSHSSYSSYLVSNSVDARLETSTLFPVELGLQVMMKDSYQSLLDSIKLARPISASWSTETLTESVGVCVDEAGSSSEHKKEKQKTSLSKTTESAANLKNLFDAFESIYAESFPFSFTSIDATSFLKFWNDVCHSLVKSIKRKLFSQLLPSEDCGLFASTTLSHLFRHLLMMTSGDFQSCHMTLSLIHSHLKACQLVSGSDVSSAKVNIEKERLKEVLLHCCMMENKEKESYSSKQDAVFIKLLTRIAGINFISKKGGEGGAKERGGEGKGEKGINLLLSVLVQVLKDKSDISSTPYLSALIYCLQQTATLDLLFPPPPVEGVSNHDATTVLASLSVIKDFINIILSQLVKASSPSQRPPLKLFGSVSEGDRSRRHMYYFSGSTSSQDTKWISLDAPQSQSQAVSSSSLSVLQDLIKLLKKLLGLSCAKPYLSTITEFCRISGSTSEAVYATPDAPLVDIILTDSKQLRGLLLSLTGSFTADSMSSTSASSFLGLIKDFVEFLRNNCQSLACFRELFLLILEDMIKGGGGGRGVVGVSSFNESQVLVMQSLCQFLKPPGVKLNKREVEDPETARKSKDHGHKRKGKEEKEKEKNVVEVKKEDKRQDTGDLSLFITQGGAKAVLNCFILSAQLCKATPSDHSLKHAVSGLGLLEAPKPYKEGSHLINFFPKATVKASPHGCPSLKDIQSVNLKDQTGKGAAFQYTYPKDTNWLTLHVSLTQPVLLHSVHIYQPANLSQSGPSQVKIEFSRPSSLSKPIQLSPPLGTAGLTGIRIELTSPVIANEIWLHLRRPKVTDSLSLSNLLLLGTVYGSIGTPGLFSADEEREDKKEKNTKIPSSDNNKDTSHSSEGWLNILHEWIQSVPGASDSINSVVYNEMHQFLPVCVSLLNNRSLSSLALKNLQSLLLSVSSSYHEFGNQFTLLLFKSQFPEATPFTVSKVTSGNGSGIDLLLLLLKAEGESGLTRVVSVLKMISELLSDSSVQVSSSLPAMLRAVANTLWNTPAGSASHLMDLGLNEELFKSLLNISISQECCTSLKLSLSSILMSLCRLHPPWFSVAMTIAASLLEELPSSESGRVLQTLADSSLSDECMNMLLSSQLLRDIICRLTSSVKHVLMKTSGLTSTPASNLKTESPLDPDVESSISVDPNTESIGIDSDSKSISIDCIRSTLVSICSLVGFLTDLVFGHKLAQEALVSSSDGFLPLLMKLCNEPSDLIPHNEMEFLQHIMQQYLSVCSKFSVLGKKQFINLLLNCLQGKYSLEPVTASGDFGSSVSLEITPFIRTLIIDHILGPEAVHLLLEIDECLLPQSLSSTSPSSNDRIKLDSITPSYDCPHYHPSYPLNTNYYYLKLSSEYTLNRLLSLLSLGSERPSSNGERVAEGGTGGGSKTSSNQTKKPFQINIFDFSVIAQPDATSSKVSIAFKSEAGKEMYPIGTRIRQVPPSLLYGCSHSRALRVSRAETSSLVADFNESESFLKVFAESGGVFILSQLFPFLHPGLWKGCPTSFESVVNACVSRLPSYSPASFLLPHSYVALGLGMRLREYGEILGRTELRTYVWYLLRGVLGATEEIEKQLPPSLLDLLSFLPFLYLFHIVRSSSSSSERLRLRAEMYRIGIIHHILSCLSGATQHKPRSGGNNNREKTDAANKLESSKNVKTVTSKDKEYWAKGTGFGTGSTSSAWDISAMLQENQSNELLSSLCLAILGEWLNIREENEEKNQVMEEEEKKESEEGSESEEKGSDKDATDAVNNDPICITSDTGTITSSRTSNDDMDPALGSGGEGAQNEITEDSNEDLEFMTSEGIETESLSSIYLYTEDVIKTLSVSCLIPALAHYLSNDSILDISNHTQVYKSVLLLLLSMARNQSCHHLLFLKINLQSDDDDDQFDKSRAIKSRRNLANLVQRLNGIAQTYLKTLNIPKKSPESVRTPRKQDSSSTTNANDPLVSDSNPPPSTSKASLPHPPPKPVLVSPLHPPLPLLPPLPTHSHPPSSTSPSLPPSVPTPHSSSSPSLASISFSSSTSPFPPPPPPASPPPIPPRLDKKGQVELPEIISLIVKCSKEIESIASDREEEEKEIKRVDSADSKNEDYIEAMRPLQFDTYQITEYDPNDESKLIFAVPYHYSNQILNNMSNIAPSRARRLAQEVASLSTSLPLSLSSTVFLCCDEERLDVMKVLITGPSDTPYANGCFLFDVYFPPEYPSVPMSINLCTTGQGSVRFNPNLYNDGKVCLSVLNTWHGRPEEKWNPTTSSFLQVLVSIQSLILVPEPFFNEPGYEQHRGTPYGDSKSLIYNADIFVATIQWAMIDNLRQPSPCFKQIILKHFYYRKEEILQQCNKWRTELVEGTIRLSLARSNGGALRRHCKDLVKQIDILKVELDTINPSDFDV
uniref:UBC core domain-containing protein n=1 Tax=Amphimedon queenslandica TaxID=400682 RepID=A0A1X7VLP9_AMPQE